MGYDRTPEEQDILNRWPVVTEEDIVKMNDLFPHYLFFRRTVLCGSPMVIFHASCCGRKVELPLVRRTEVPEENELLNHCHHDWEYTCPWCGRAVTMKDLSKAGKRKMLRRYECTMLLHADGDALYGDALCLCKEYDTDAALTARPEYWLSSGYRFTIGDVMEIDYQTYDEKGWISHEKGQLGRRKWVQEPFKKGSISWYTYEPYSVLNREVLTEHPKFKYCEFFGCWQYRSGGVRGYAFKFHDFVSYLTAYCIYPKQVEMFVKIGYTHPVADLIYNRCKNAGAIDWKESDARKALGLDKRELKQFLAVRLPLEAVAVKKYVARHWKKNWKLSFCTDFAHLWGCDLSPMYVLSFLKRFRIDPERFLRYLGGRFDEEGIEDVAYKNLFDTYRDYMEASYELGRCLEHTAVLYPLQLYTAHDEAVGELAKQQLGKPSKYVPAGVRARRLKYEFEMDGLRIVFPLTAAAIKREGDVLHHCVGGYAERHMKGVLNILFLRKADAPATPYVTIEMRGNKIQQIHGYLNDRGSVSPRTTHKAFINTWLKWLEKGSPRNEDGTPKLPKKKNKEVSVA